MRCNIYCWLESNGKWNHPAALHLISDPSQYDARVRQAEFTTACCCDDKKISDSDYHAARI